MGNRLPDSVSAGGHDDGSCRSGRRRGAWIARLARICSHVCRHVHGAAGGTLIPVVFSAVFLLFKKSDHGIATTFAGVLAVLAPTVGPVVGGWITQTYSWHWLFLINIGPGLVSTVVACALLPRPT